MAIVSLVRDHQHLLPTNPVLAIAQREIRAAVAINEGFWRELQRRARSLRMVEGERQLFWQKGAASCSEAALPRIVKLLPDRKRDFGLSFCHASTQAEGGHCAYSSSTHSDRRG